MFITGTQKVLVRTVFLDCRVAKTTTFVVSTQAQILPFSKLYAVSLKIRMSGAQDAQILVWEDTDLSIVCTIKG